MEIDIQPRYVASVVAEERIRNSHREPIKLTRSINVSRILHSFAKLFR